MLVVGLLMASLSTAAAQAACDDAPTSTLAAVVWADAVAEADRLNDAEQLYVALLAGDPGPCRDHALWQLLWVRALHLRQQHGAVEARPADARVERRVILPSGRKRAVYALDEPHRRFLEVADAVVSLRPTDPALADKITRAQPEIALLAAKVLVELGRFDEARPRLYALVEAGPPRDEGTQGLYLLIESYGADEDLGMVRSLADRAVNGQLPGVLLRTGLTAGALVESVDFEGAMALVRSDRAAAAEALLRFIDDYPGSPHVREALYNAASCYEIIGRVDEANALFERYADQYPRDALTATLLYRIGWKELERLNLEEAVQRFDLLVQNFPDFPGAPGALYNASYLRVCLGDHAGAARGFERYGQIAPEQLDAPDVAFLAGAEWERVSDAAARAFYLRYLNQWPASRPEQVLKARYALCMLAERGGVPSTIARAWAQLDAEVQRLGRGEPLSPAARHIAASSALHHLQGSAEALRAARPGANRTQDLLLLQQREVALALLEAEARSLIETWQDFEASSAALTLLGEAEDSVGDLQARLTPPARVSGRAHLEEALALGAQERTWTGWQSRAQADLAERDPDAHPAAWSELRGAFDAAPLPYAGPLLPRRSP